MTYVSAHAIRLASIAVLWAAAAGAVEQDASGGRVGEPCAAAPSIGEPRLAWNTFLGGSSNDMGTAIAIDRGGNIFVVGQSDDTWGKPIRAYASSSDVFVAKLTSAGALVWTTF